MLRLTRTMPHSRVHEQYHEANRTTKIVAQLHTKYLTHVALRIPSPREDWLIERIGNRSIRIQLVSNEVHQPKEWQQSNPSHGEVA